MNIEVLEGETLDQAIQRTAKALAKAEPEAKPREAARSRGSSRSRGKSRVVSEDPTPETESEVYAALHVYQRAGEPNGVVESNARRERNLHGPNTLVFKHMHRPGEGCNIECREKVFKEAQ